MKITSMNELGALSDKILEYQGQYILCKKQYNDDPVQAYEGKFYLLQDTFISDTLYVSVIYAEDYYPSIPIYYETFFEHFELITQGELRKRKIDSIINDRH